jgi:hypothetical protein
LLIRATGPYPGHAWNSTTRTPYGETDSLNPNTARLLRAPQSVVKTRNASPRP